MGAYNVINATSMTSGAPEDVSQILANFNAIAAVINGGLDNSNIASAAAIAYSKLALSNAIKNADVDPAAAIAASKLAAGSDNTILKSFSGVSQWSTQSGAELAGGTYTTKTSSGTPGTLVFDFGTLAFDGTTTIELLLTSPFVSVSPSSQSQVQITDHITGSDVNVNRLCFWKNDATSSFWIPFMAVARFVPPSGNRNYRLFYVTNVGAASTLNTIDSQPGEASIRRLTN